MYCTQTEIKIPKVKLKIKKIIWECNSLFWVWKNPRVCTFYVRVNLEWPINTFTTSYIHTLSTTEKLVKNNKSICGVMVIGTTFFSTFSILHNNLDFSFFLFLSLFNFSDRCRYFSFCLIAAICIWVICLHKLQELRYTIYVLFLDAHNFKLNWQIN